MAEQVYTYLSIGDEALFVRRLSFTSDELAISEAKKLLEGPLAQASGRYGGSGWSGR